MTSKAVKTLGLLRKLSPFDNGLGAYLPEAYRKFYNEWKLAQPVAVHQIVEEGRWRRNDVTNEVFPIQNIPIPLKYPTEYDEQLWGGEGVVQGFQKREESSRRVPHFWVPHLRRSVVYSEVLNKHISVVVTSRAIQLINSNYGFDHYLLKTPACDLKSLLALKLKRKILQELQNGCPTYASNLEKQKEIFNRYKEYLSAYTPEEIEWYGYSLKEARNIIKDKIDAENKPVPLKAVYRAELLEKLKAAQIAEAQGVDMELGESTSWIQRMNPFGKKHET